MMASVAFAKLAKAINQIQAYDAGIVTPGQFAVEQHLGEVAAACANRAALTAAHDPGCFFPPHPDDNLSQKGTS
jgi:hypothetical protein